MRVGLEWNTADTTTIKLTVHDMPGRNDGLVALIQRIDWFDERYVTPYIEYFRDPASYKLTIHPGQWVLLNEYISSTDTFFDRTRHAFFEARRIEQQINALTTGYFWNQRCAEAARERAGR